MNDASERVSAFRASLSPILLATDDFIDWDTIEAEIENARGTLAHLQAYVREGDITTENLTEKLQTHPKIYEIIQSLIAFRSSGDQVEKWGLPAFVPKDRSRARWLARQLIHVGVKRLLLDSDIEPMLRVAEVYKDSIRRRFRSGKTLGEKVRSLVQQAVKEADAEFEAIIRLNPSALADTSLRRSVEYIVAHGSRPVAGIATVFQNQSGGRQQRDLSQTYPLLQEKLAAHGLALILIADGQGLREASERTLSALFNSVRYPLSIKQAEEGMLKESIIAACATQAPETLDQAALNRLISDILGARSSINAEELPIAPGQATLALARFAETRTELNLALSPGGETLEWKNTTAVSEARALSESFSPSRAIELFGSLIASEKVSPLEQNEGDSAVLGVPDTPPFTSRIYVAATRNTIDADLTRKTGIRSMEEAPGSSIAILLTPSPLSEQEIEAHRKHQAVRPVNVIVVSPKKLLEMAQRTSPITTLIDVILTQSDLTKVSPFVLSNPTPVRMFYGRESEAATVLSTIATNSVAILGSRRIGKTSFIKRIQDDLSASNFRPFFGDCQTVRTWTDFAKLARQEWHVDIPDEFEPRHLHDLISQLSSSDEGGVVLLLDEIDQLLEWDRSHSEDSVPEAFFRACRSISQSGKAQFVFSGERTIATRIWDPQSPHWNFCRPLALSQLIRDAATLLLVRPLREMNIQIRDESDFSEKAWDLTSGHPQIVQFLGDRLIRLLDERSDRTQLELGIEDVQQIAGNYEFAEHYISTYWGQATRLEKIISLLVTQLIVNVADLGEALSNLSVGHDSEDLMSAIRMLRLYGVLEESEQRIVLRAKWFPEALEHFGGADAELSRLTGEMEN